MIAHAHDVICVPSKQSLLMSIDVHNHNNSSRLKFKDINSQIERANITYVEHNSVPVNKLNIVSASLAVISGHICKLEIFLGLYSGIRTTWSLFGWVKHALNFANLQELNCKRKLEFENLQDILIPIKKTQGFANNSRTRTYRPYPVFDFG